MRYFTLFFFYISLLAYLPAQTPVQPTSAELYEQIQKLQVLGSVLYVAAHPDDENTRMISYLANERKVNTAYLSLTRGDGGQNLIGTEIQELLGVLRTQELMAARRIDNGYQMFSRANDFGYSKHPDETLKIWNREEVLGDVVWAIRKWRPDVIINRFDHRTAGRTHGHHTASAVLSYEAFDLAGSKKNYSEQTNIVQPWQPKRIYMNTSWWFYGSREKFAELDKSDMAEIDIGVYYPIKGTSNNEIAALSRSQHRCQGMGNIGSRGSQIEYLERLKGDVPGDKNDIFDGIDITWNRVKGGAKIGQMLHEIEHDFNFAKPHLSLPALMLVYKKIKGLKDGYWKGVKLAEMEELIQGSMGLFAEAIAKEASATPGENLKLDLEIIARLAENVELKSIEVLPLGIDSVFNIPMQRNEGLRVSKSVTLTTDLAFTNPYWLNKKGDLGMFDVEEQTLIGLPETPRQFKIKWNLDISGTPFSFETDVVNKRREPAVGEVYRPFEVTPPVYANLTEKVFIFANQAPQKVKVKVKAGKPNLKGTIELSHDEKWIIKPAKYDFELSQKGKEQVFEFEVYPPDAQSEAFVSPLVKVDGKTYTQEIIEIEYDHVPTQTIFRNSEAKVVKIDLKKAGRNIGYLMGAGDEIPESLRQIGYDVTLLDPNDLSLGTLEKYDAVVTGVRAYNTLDELKFGAQDLLKYSENGGTLIIQYNTRHRMKTEDFAPFPIKLSRDRVTVEEAEVRLLKPDHEVLNFPNKITTKDFDGWIQERGLYFPSEWDEKYDAILSSNDPGETPKDGGLLVAKHGEGYFIYTGYSWFRELPAGVPGAFRIFANMISIGKGNRP